jgi:ATP-dependent Clp protease adaptor protein ClpS
MAWKVEESTVSSCEYGDEVTVPPDYKVILFNDDYTTKEFVVDILVKVFHKSELEAVALMETVHRKGSAVVGVYTYDIAATRVAAVVRIARVNGYPLRCELEVA